jgi:hypothetical protein
LLHEDGVFVGQQIPGELLKYIESLSRKDFDYKEDVALMLVADCGVELGIESGFVLREIVKVNNNTIDITEFDTDNAVDKTTKKKGGFWELGGPDQGC